MNIKTTALAIMTSMITINATAQSNAPQLRADNIDEVMAAMTIQEKAQLLVGGGNEGFVGSGAMFGNQKTLVPGAAGITVAIPRLGIPATVLTDGPAGVRIDPRRDGDPNTYYATGFPVGTCLACTWNTDLVRKVGEAIGNETLEYGCDVILGPGMNIHRSPLCGRNFEYYSEDPVVTGRIAIAATQGIQSQGVGVSAKHFAVNSQENCRTKVDERVSQRALREIYLRGFEMVVREADPWTVMASYNSVNGKFSMHNHDMLTTILRDEWGFKGIVVSDWIGKRKPITTISEVEAGNDIMMPGFPEQAQDIVDGVNNGTLDIKLVDRNVRRVLEYIVKTPNFKKHNASKPDLEAHAQVTRQSSTEGMVLLKNNLFAGADGQTAPTLPFRNLKTVALFGVNSYDFMSGGLGSGCVNVPYVVDMVTGLKNVGVSTTPLLTDIYQKYVQYAKAKLKADRIPGMWFLDMGQPKLEEIEITEYCVAHEIGDADAAIITIGRQAGEGIDRQIDGEFNLSRTEQDMIFRVSDAFHAQNKPVIVIINSGSVIETASWRDRADAILCAWQPGEEGGNSVADVLTGKANPSGKLTMTWPIAATDHPSTKNFTRDYDLYTYRLLREHADGIPGDDFTNHEEDIYVGYRYFDTFGKEVAYPFGYGLSYTTFEYGKPTVKQNGETITVSLTVKNTGSVSGKEVVQVYVAAPEGAVEKPAKELKGFAKTHELKPGESETLQISMQRRDLASFNEAQSAWVVDEGVYTFMTGANIADIRGTATLKIAGMTEKVNDVMKPLVELKCKRQHSADNEN
ncbi:MAG: glycoside hydrolase family 3 C-terminal domain-containing protein [Prevotella sp.]|nr:glycoside hydrolase family 3 C-terminal domain-containing protein [Prevotella sp.]